jgi:Fuc2NAc and GlcNAc transferase
VSRSAHSNPTPISGGLSFVTGILLASSLGWSFGWLGSGLLLAVWGGLPVAVAGFLDDWRELTIRQRLLPQLLAVGWALYWLGGVQLDWWLLSAVPWLLPALAALAMLWLLNLYNFMDGIDGLAASEALCVNALSLLLVISSDDTETVFLSGLAFTGIAGFLVWNWGPARIFMGDVGSGFIGFLLGVIAVYSINQGSLSIWSWVILLGVFLSDATLTLAIRFVSGQPWSQGHSCHAYQHLSRRVKSHRKVTILVIAINLLWLLPLALVAQTRPEWGMALAGLSVVPLLIVAYWAGAGRQSAPGQSMPGQSAPE